MVNLSVSFGKEVNAKIAHMTSSFGRSLCEFFPTGKIIHQGVICAYVAVSCICACRKCVILPMYSFPLFLVLGHVHFLLLGKMGQAICLLFLKYPVGVTGVVVNNEVLVYCCCTSRNNEKQSNHRLLIFS